MDEYASVQYRRSYLAFASVESSHLPLSLCLPYRLAFNTGLALGLERHKRFACSQSVIAHTLELGVAGFPPSLVSPLSFIYWRHLSPPCKLWSCPVSALIYIYYALLS